MEHAIDLQPDGGFRAALTVMLDGRYQVSGRVLTIAWDESTDLSSAEGTPFEVTADTLPVNATRSGKTARMTRTGSLADPKAPIVGRWRYRHYTGGTAFEQYTADGRVSFRLPLPGSTEGCFTIRDGVIALAGQTLRRSAGDVLRPEAESESVYEHAGAAWNSLLVNR